MLRLNARTDLVFVFLFFFSFGLIGNSWLSETDFLWHIKTGEWIWLNSAFPRTDIFSYTMAGQNWIAKEWLSQILFYFLYSYGGWSALVIFSSAIVSFAITLIYTYFTKERRLPAVLVFFACVLIFVPLARIVRPQIFMFPLMALLLVSFDKAGIQRRIPSLWILPLTVLWTNIHASFPLIFVFFFFYLLEAFWRAPSNEWRMMFVKFFFLAIALLLAMGITPYGYQSLFYAINFVQSDIDQIINEWHSYPEIIKLFGIGDYIYYLALPLAITIFASFILMPDRLNWPRIAGSVFFLISAIKHFRFLQIYSFYTMFAALSASKPAFDRLQLQVWSEESHKIFRHVLMGSIAIFSISAFFVMPRAPLDHLYPTRALAAAQSYGVKGHVINSYDFGGFLIFNDVKTFVDGRAELFLGKIVPELRDVMNSGDQNKIKSFIDRYEISWAFFMTGLEDDKAFQNLPGWKNIYRDDAASIYVRENP